jgi:hypothetical protein
MLIKFTVNPNIQLTVKPNPKEVGEISKGMTAVGTLENGIYSMINMLEQGYVFCPAVFTNNHRSNNTWLEQQIIMLDFDNGVLPEEIMDRLESKDLTYQLIYSTFSDSEAKRKFRLVFILNTVLKNKEQRDWIIIKLLGLFPEADKSVRDAARLFYPCKKILYYNEGETDLDALIKVLETIETTDYDYRTAVDLSKFKASNNHREVLNMLNNYMNKRGIYFMKGNRHRYTIIFSAVANHFGVSNLDCIGELHSLGNSYEDTEKEVNDVYQRYRHQHNIKTLC